MVRRTLLQRCFEGGCDMTGGWIWGLFFLVLFWLAKFFGIDSIS